MSRRSADMSRRSADMGGGHPQAISEQHVAIRGNATPDDVAAVLATLRELAARKPGGYDSWRAQRITALRRCPPP